MRQYLLFDSGCATCSNLAQAIEREVDGELTARSLRDPEMQELLDRADPDWEWQPTLLEVNSDQMCVYTGLRLCTRLLLSLGPRRTWRVIRLIRDADLPKTKLDKKRRELFRRGSAILAGFMILPHTARTWSKSASGSRRGSESNSVSAQNLPDGGELYVGFLLLPDGAQAPAIIEPPQNAMPVVCGAGTNTPTGRTESFESVEALAAVTNFPLYTLEQLDTLQFKSARFLAYDEGPLTHAFVTFNTYSEELNRWEPAVRIVAEPDFARPYPLWEQDPVEPDGPAVRLEKIDFLPTPGIMIRSERGFIFHWIENAVLYTLYVEPSPSFMFAATIAKKLSRVP